VNPEAHDAYLKGRYFINRPSDENLKKAIAQFEEAISLDPNFAPAYSGLSDAYVWAGFNEGVFTAAEAMPEGSARAQWTASIALWKLESAPSPRSPNRRPLNLGRIVRNSSRWLLRASNPSCSSRPMIAV
jgi:hypothetical protein